MNRDDVKQFCESEAYRYATDLPWVEGGYLVATDARILIAVPTSEPDSGPDDRGKKRPDAAGILANAANVESVHDWPAEFPPCGTCDDSGTKQVFEADCPECGGSGEQECDLGHMHECEHCAGDGVVASTTSRPSRCGCRVDIGGRQFDRHYVHLISTLIPGPLKWGRAGGYAPLVVRGADGVIAVLMPFKD